MSLNIDMSDIIEFVLPMKNEFSDHNNDGGGGDDDEAESKNHYVVLDAVDVGREFKHEEFLLVNDDGTESELLMGNAQLHQQLVNCPELHQAMLRVPKMESFEEVQYMVADQQSDELDDLVEEEELEEDDEGQYEQYEDNIESEQIQEHQFEWNYLQMQSPEEEAESEAIELVAPTRSPLPAVPAAGAAAAKAHSKTSNNTTQQSLKRGYISSSSQSQHTELMDDLYAYEEIGLSTSATSTTSEIAVAVTVAASEEPAKLATPSDKMLDLFKGPRRYMLFDELIATIVDFDEDRTPIVEFSMIGSIQDEKLPVECGICPDVMHKSKLSKHQKTHLVPGTNRYACIYCTETYRDCKYLAGHARRHMGIRPYVCEPCKLYFSTKQDLRVHNQRRHLEKEHICEMCGKTFAQNTQLKRHREATHEKKRRFQCQYCQKAYYKNFSLQEHIRNVHMGKRRMLKCPFCGMQCRDAHKMARHRKEMHLNQDTYVCHLCQEEFTDINYFDAHKRSIQCRSNTRRMVTEDETEGADGENQAPNGEEDANFISESDQLAGMLEEDFDEDAGLLVEADGDADADMAPDANVDGGDDVVQQLPADTIYETINGNYLHEAGEEGDNSEQQFVQQYEQNTYDDDSLLVEQLPEEDDHSEQILEDDEQYLEAIDEGSFQQKQLEQQFQSAQQQLQQVGQEYNDDELIYEIILETEDN